MKTALLFLCCFVASCATTQTYTLGVREFGPDDYGGTLSVTLVPTPGFSK